MLSSIGVLPSVGTPTSTLKTGSESNHVGPHYDLDVDVTTSGRSESESISDIHERDSHLIILIDEWDLWTPLNATTFRVHDRCHSSVIHNGPADRVFIPA